MYVMALKLPRIQIRPKIWNRIQKNIKNVTNLMNVRQKLKPDILKTAQVNSVKDAFFLQVMFRTCYLFLVAYFFEKVFFHFYFDFFYDCKS